MRIIDKLISYKKVIKINSKSNKNVLISYVLFPLFFNKNHKYYKQSHTNKLMCYLFVDVLKELGYNVFIYDYLNENVDFTKKYDIFIGHNKTFYKIASKLNSDCKKILLTTGCSPEFDNKQLLLRQSALNKRRNNSSLKLYSPLPDNDKFPYLNFNIADFIYMIAANTVPSRTWYTEYSNKFYHYDNLTQFIPIKKEKITPNNFIFMSSTGQLRRGLDLVLETFSKLKENKVYICGPYEQEKIFCDEYSKEIYNTLNIIPCGIVNTSKNNFLEIVNDCEFVIVPSCSEGQSGSVLNLMTLGLIPIITEEVGFIDVEEYGFLIPDGSINSVMKTVKRAILATENEKNSKRQKLFEKVKNHTPEVVKQNFKNFIKETIHE